MGIGTSKDVEGQVGAVLDQLRDRACTDGLSDAKVGELAGMDRSDVSKLLHGRTRGMPKLVVLARLAGALGYKLKLVLSRLVQ